MTIEALTVFHYLYGYQTMRLASQDEIKSTQTLAGKELPQGADTEVNRGNDHTVKNEQQEEGTVERKIKPPDGVALCISSIPGAKFGACSLKDIPAGTWFGPFEGKLVRRNEAIGGSMSEFMWEIFHDGEVSHFLDGRNQNTWMSFVKCARHKKEQNMVVFQYHGCIYYRTTREITPGSELLVWYDAKYTQFLGLPLSWNESKSTSGKRKGTANFHSENARRKRPNEDGNQDLAPVQKLVENQSIPLQKKKKMQCQYESKPCSRTRTFRMTEVKMPANGNETGVLHSHTLHRHRRGTNSRAYQLPYHSYSVYDENGLKSTEPFQYFSSDKGRECSDHHYWQDRGRNLDGHFNHRQTFDYQQGGHEKEIMGCKNNQFAYPVALSSHVHPAYNYYQYNGKKHEDTCRFRDIKEGCIPRE